MISHIMRNYLCVVSNGIILFKSVDPTPEMCSIYEMGVSLKVLLRK